jgi:hypothetical protein
MKTALLTPKLIFVLIGIGLSLLGGIIPWGEALDWAAGGEEIDCPRPLVLPVPSSSGQAIPGLTGGLSPLLVFSAPVPTGQWIKKVFTGSGRLAPTADHLDPSISGEGATRSLFPPFDHFRHAFQGTEKRKPWFRRHWLAAIFFFLISLYLVAMIGVSGGPNHGEHPLLLNIGHLILLYVYGGHWASDYYYAYQNLLLAAIGLSLAAFVLRFTLLAWVIRIGMTGIYVGLFCLLHLKDGPV